MLQYGACPDRIIESYRIFRGNVCPARARRAPGALLLY